MAYPLLTFSPASSSSGQYDSQQPATALHDQVQIALAIADADHLKGLLTTCTPPLANAAAIGNITATIGVPLDAHDSIDAIVEYEAIQCVLAEPGLDLEQTISHHNGTGRSIDLTRCESELMTIGQSLTLSQALSLLEQAGFSVSQIDQIMALPSEAWYKSWWHLLDETGAVGLPFLRLMRTRRYVDGTYRFQYRDFYAQDKPPCFRSQLQQVLVHAKPQAQPFSKTLERIHFARQVFGAIPTLLICDRLSHLEAQGFIRQGISLFTSEEVVLPTQANCTLCATETCPMRGQRSSPVLMCNRFCLEGVS